MKIGNSHKSKIGPGLSVQTWQNHNVKSHLTSVRCFAENPNCKSPRKLVAFLLLRCSLLSLLQNQNIKHRGIPQPWQSISRVSLVDLRLLCIEQQGRDFELSRSVLQNPNFLFRSRENVARWTLLVCFLMRWKLKEIF